jgi:hypothetical protein
LHRLGGAGAIFHQQHVQRRGLAKLCVGFVAKNERSPLKRKCIAPKRMPQRLSFSGKAPLLLARVDLSVCSEVD